MIRTGHPANSRLTKMLIWLLFFFVAFGSKVVLATAMIYLILEEERGCPACDAETMLMRMGLPGRTLSLVSLGRVQKRWCPRCGWEGLTRTGRLNRPLHSGAVARPDHAAAPRKPRR